jgi:uracil-DNA glycosylase
MTARREAILREMGLAPLWKSRRASPDQSFRVEDDEPDEPPQTPSVAREARIAKMDWTALRAEVDSCTACPLHKSRTRAVFGVGDKAADWLIVGEAPGAEEDQQGEPFVGQAGRLLDAMLAAIGMDRSTNVYIANVLKCRPPGNRNPDGSEVAQCSPHLSRQIALIRPRLILAMGKFAVQALLGTDASIASLRGKVHACNGVPLIVTYHPAYLLRTLPDKAKAWQDLRFAVRSFEALQTRPPAPT